MTLSFLANKYNLMYFLSAYEGTKSQLDGLTNDIKGNANVVRTKLKCEFSCDCCTFLSCVV